MRKIICNNKLKKLCTTLILFMLLFNVVFPCVVWATAEDAKKAINSGLKVIKNSDTKYTYTGTIQELVYAFNTKTYDQTPNPSLFDLNRTSLAGNEPERYEGLVKAAIKYYIEDQNYSIETSDANLDKIYHDMKDSEKIQVTAVIKRGLIDQTTGEWIWSVTTSEEDATFFEKIGNFLDGRWVVTVEITSKIFEIEFKRAIERNIEDIEKVDYRNL